MEMDATPQAMPSGEPSKGGMGKKILGAVIILIILIGGVWYWMSRPAAGSPEAAAKEVAAVVAEVGQVMVLPEDETPTVGTVTDPSVFAGQAFFAGVQTGDKILVYPKRGMVVLYSVSLKKILGVAPLTVGANPTIPAASTDTSTDSAE
jgi:hypothetical protein